MLYFTSDQHYGHENAIMYCDRPFTNTGKMERTLTRNYNNTVGQNDITFFLGDISLRGSENLGWYRGLLKKLNGKKILVLGNHDKLRPFQYVECGFKSVHTSYILKHDGIIYGLAHDPAYSINGGDMDYWICGHVHTMFKTLGNIINVGVDVHDYKPISMIDVVELLDARRTDRPK